MKKLITTLLSGLFVFGLYAQTLGGSELPKALNYKEVISNIEYPTLCKEEGLEGRIIVVLEINASGEMTNYTFGPSPCQDLTNAVKMELTNLKFSPAIDSNGEATAGKISLPVNFKLTI